MLDEESGLLLDERKTILVLEHVTLSKDCADAFRKLGYEVLYREYEGVDSLIKLVHEEGPDYLFTINFIPSALEICRECEIPYISWVVDSPYYALFYEQVCKSDAYIFHYDNFVVNRLKEMDYKNVFYLPVAADTERFDNIIVSEDEKASYSADISFIGDTGSKNEYNEFALATHLGKDLIARIESYFKKQFESEDRFLLKDLITDDFIKAVSDKLEAPVKEDGLISVKEKMAYILARKYNEFRRKDLLGMLGTHFDTSVWGDFNWKQVDVPKLKYQGFAEHFEVMPKIIKSSKINLNQIRVYVDSGLPMRVFDVLGCKGFLATNSRDDIEQLFTPGKDLVVWRDNKDLKELVEYYLNHEQERLEIAEHGYQTVCKKHTFMLRLKKMLTCVESAEIEHEKI